MTSTTAPILRQRMQLALLNRHQKQKSLLQKGFTLVELMIVIVIVGILSAVALPNFLSQTDKAKLTEAQATSSAYLKQYYATALEGETAASNFSTNECPEASENWSYSCDGASITATAKFGDNTAYTGSIDTTTGVVTPLAVPEGV